MKKQKRNPENKTFTRGYRAGAERKSKDLAPVGTSNAIWMAGWREGRADNWDGLIGVSAIHKMSY